MVDLKRYLKLNESLKNTKKLIEKLESKSTMTADTAKDYSTGKPLIIKLYGYDVVTHYKIKKYKVKKEKLENDVIEELEKLEDFINTIKSPYIKAIFEFKYISNMTFEEIADEIETKKSVSGDAIRKAHNRYLEDKKVKI